MLCMRERSDLIGLPFGWLIDGHRQTHGSSRFFPGREGETEDPSSTAFAGPAAGNPR